MRKTKQTRFYVFTERKSGKQYFHDPISNTVTYFPPEGAIFVDSLTNKEISIDIQKILTENNPTPIAKVENNAEVYQNVVSSPPRRRQGRPERNQRTKSSASLSEMTSRRSSVLISLGSSGSITGSNLVSSNSSLPIYLPQEIVKDSQSFDVRSFAQSHFNKRTRGSIFSKKEIPPDELLVFDTDSSVLPILKSTPNALKKKCEEIFHLVFEYCKQSPKAQPSVFVDMIFKDKALIDETYIILMKLIRNNPSEDDTKKVWDIILVMCTFFPPGHDLQPFVRHVVASEALGTKPTINSIAKIAYLRLAARCDCGEIFPLQPKNWTNLIPTHIVQDSFVFGAPLLELIYAQRRSSPKCTIPLFMHHFCNALFAAGAHKVEGTFRLPGNKVQIDLMVEAIHNGKNVFNSNAELNDLASLFKRWLADLPAPIVPMSMYNQLVEALNNKTLMDFVDTLPKVNHDTLGYLVGFLQQFIKSVDVTKMGIIPVSMIFGANVVRIVSDNADVMKKMTDDGKKFMAYLLEKWDVSFIYPLPVDFLT